MNDYENAVSIIKQAVEKSRYRAAKAGNAELLSLYYGIGKYVSENVCKSPAGGQEDREKLAPLVREMRCYGNYSVQSFDK
jgi:hypothetical protein